MTTGPDQNPLLDEQLSAWLDDELPAGEVELLAARLTRSPEHRGRAARYGLIGATLRGNQPDALAAGLAALQVSRRVSAALDQPSDPVVPPAALRKTRLLPYGVAAGVAVATLALVPLLRPVSGPAQSGPVPVQATVVPAADNALRPQYLVADRVSAGGQTSLSPGRLTNYLVYHGEYSGMLSTKLTDSHIVNNRSYAVALQTADPSPAR